MAIVNLKALQVKLNKLATVSEQAAVGAMVRWAETIMTSAKKLTPVDTGTLRSSGIVAAPKRTGNRVDIVLGFGGAAKAYALRVHEDPNARHPVGQAKFLSTPFKTAVPKIVEAITKDLRNKYRKL